MRRVMKYTLMVKNLTTHLYWCTIRVLNFIYYCLS